MTLYFLWLIVLLALTQLAKATIIFTMIKLHHAMRPQLTFAARAGLLSIAALAGGSFFETLGIPYVARPWTAMLLCAIAAVAALRAFKPAIFGYSVAARASSVTATAPFQPKLRRIS